MGEVQEERDSHVLDQFPERLGLAGHPKRSTKSVVRYVFNMERDRKSFNHHTSVLDEPVYHAASHKTVLEPQIHSVRPGPGVGSLRVPQYEEILLPEASPP